MPYFNHIEILGVRVSAINISLACQAIHHWIETRTRTYVCVVPVSTIVACQENKDYLRVVNEAGMSTPDGMPVVWIGKIKKCKHIERTYGPDLMLAFCEDGLKKGYRHYFYGGTQQSCHQLELTLKKKFPGIKIAGKYSPPFRRLTLQEDKRCVEEINRLKPDILWVGLGSPKQDFWMKEHRDKLEVPVMIGVGAAFDFLSGVKQQAPKWVQRSGLEWFFRLCQEPKRLWHRYLIGNSKFIFYLLKEQIQKILKRR